MEPHSLPVEESGGKFRSAAWWVFAILAGLLILQALHYYSLMPEKMATHFGIGGWANGWMAKNDFFLMLGGLCCFIAVLFAVLPRLIAKFPDSLINIPNKPYWMTPERRPKAMAILGRNMLWMANLVLALFLGMGYLTYKANLMAEPALDERLSLFLMAGFVTGMLATVILLIVAYRVPKGPDLSR
jgi:uncharacterized membrane protein